eukprot:scaffold705_cov402-Prasinococcus_capsulatus_cf.AAC.26
MTCWDRFLRHLTRRGSHPGLGNACCPLQGDASGKDVGQGAAADGPKLGVHTSPSQPAGAAVHRPRKHSREGPYRCGALVRTPPSARGASKSSSGPLFSRARGTCTGWMDVRPQSSARGSLSAVILSADCGSALSGSVLDKP